MDENALQATLGGDWVPYAEAAKDGAESIMSPLAFRRVRIKPQRRAGADQAQLFVLSVDRERDPT